MHRRSEATAVGDCGAPNMVLDGEHEHEMQEVKAKLLVVLRRSGEARSSGNAVTAELGGGVHGNRSHGESRGSEGEWEGQERNEGGVLSERRGRRASPNARGSDRDAWQQWQACSAAWATRRPSDEHLARVGMAEVGS